MGQSNANEVAAHERFSNGGAREHVP